MSEVKSLKDPAPYIVEYLADSFDAHESAELPEGVSVYAWISLNVTPRILFTLEASEAEARTADHVFTLEMHYTPPAITRDDENKMTAIRGVGDTLDAIERLMIAYLMDDRYLPDIKIASRGPGTLRVDVESGEIDFVKSFEFKASFLS